MTSQIKREGTKYVNKQKRNEFAEIVESERLKAKEAKEFIETSFRCSYMPEGGLEPNSIMPSINPFDPMANREGCVHRYKRWPTELDKPV